MYRLYRGKLELGTWDRDGADTGGGIGEDHTIPLTYQRYDDTVTGRGYVWCSLFTIMKFGNLLRRYSYKYHESLGLPFRVWYIQIIFGSCVPLFPGSPVCESPWNPMSPSSPVLLYCRSVINYCTPEV
jgi:hypothetical protein